MLAKWKVLSERVGTIQDKTERWSFYKTVLHKCTPRLREIPRYVGKWYYGMIVLFDWLYRMLITGWLFYWLVRWIIGWDIYAHKACRCFKDENYVKFALWLHPMCMWRGLCVRLFCVFLVTRFSCVNTYFGYDKKVDLFDVYLNKLEKKTQERFNKIMGVKEKKDEDR